MERRSVLEEATLEDLWRDFKKGGSMSARQTLIEHYSYLARVTGKRLGRNLPARILLEDVIAEAAIGLILAVDRFDPNRKVKFETFAISIMRGRLLDYFRDDDWIPRSVRENCTLLAGAIETLRQAKGAANITDADLAAYLGLSIEALERLRSNAQVFETISLNEDRGGFDPDGGGISVESSIADKGPDLFTLALTESQREVLAEAMSHLPDREQIAVRLRIFEGEKLKAIGRGLQVSESRAFQLYNQGIQRLALRLDHAVELFDVG